MTTPDSPTPHESFLLARGWHRTLTWWWHPRHQIDEPHRTLDEALAEEHAETENDE